jgi:putative NIF3 family GTP cyclohydrolase 1 type 2
METKDRMEGMNMDSTITRRGFGQCVGGILAAGAGLADQAAAQAQGTITAAQVVDHIKTKLANEGVAWGPTIFDGFKMGDSNITVTGIATCFEPTFDVLRRAAAGKKNFVVSHESSFWDGFDPIEVVKNDPVAKLKMEFVAENKMAVWRIHDHWHRLKPDPIFVGLARTLGWSSNYALDSRPRHYDIPEMSLEEVARHIQRQLGTKNVVVVGDPQLRVKTLGDCAHILSSVLPALRTCDVALVGETPQHDTFEYVRDAVELGEKKAVVMISHEGLEEWGMETFANWVRPAVPEVPVEWISTGDPFYVPPVLTSRVIPK